MSRIAIVHHSGEGHTQRMAEAVAEGAKGGLIAADAECNLTEVQWTTLAAADAIIFDSPTYSGSVSWQFKKFADASSKPWFSRAWKNKIAAGSRTRTRRTATSSRRCTTCSRCHNSTACCGSAPA